LSNAKPIVFVELSGYYYSNPSLNYCLKYLENSNRTVYFVSTSSGQYDNIIDLLILPKILFKLNFLILQFFRVNLVGFYLKRLLSRKIPFCSEFWIVDPEGLLLLLGSTLQNYECWYFSYEMWFKDEISSRLAGLMSRKINSVDYIISTDAVRERLLVNEFDLANKQKFCWPVFAPENQSRPELSKLVGLKRELNDFKVVVFIGSIENWTMAPEIFGALSSLPENFKILVNSREKSKNIEKLIPVAFRPKFVINTIPLNNFLEVLSFLKLADIGIAFYKPTFTKRVLGRNIEEMGYSSGKLSTYLQAGLPVMTNVGGVFKQDLLKYKSGVYVESPENISAAINEIDANYNIYREGSISHYNSVYKIPKWVGERLLS